MLLALKFLKKLPLFFVVFFVYNCYYSEIFKNKIILNWEYSISRQEESIFQSLDKNFKIVPKDSNNPKHIINYASKTLNLLPLKIILLCN
jgi:hypothetical protein